MSSHTPGPWIVTEDYGTHVIRGADAERTEGGVTYSFRDYVASTWGGPNEADARLIAAGPEILKVLEMVRATLPHIGGNEMSVHNMLKDIDAAIAKAVQP